MALIKCPDCGADVSSNAKVCNHCGCPIKNKVPMSICRLVVGIISIVLSVLISFQSIVIGIYSAAVANGDTGGARGLFLGLAFLIAGIVGIATRNIDNKNPAVFCEVTYLVGFLLGRDGSEIFSDLKIWSYLSMVFFVIYIIAIVKIEKAKKKAFKESQESISNQEPEPEEMTEQPAGDPEDESTPEGESDPEDKKEKRILITIISAGIVFLMITGSMVVYRSYFNPL